MGVEWSGLFAQQYVEMCPADMAPGTLPTFLHGPRPLPLLPNDLFTSSSTPISPQRRTIPGHPRGSGMQPAQVTRCGRSSVSQELSGAETVCATSPGVWSRDRWP